MTNYTTEDMATMLRAAADGLSCDRAATELLIGHDDWLRRTDFIDQCITVAESISEPGRMLALIDWGSVDRALDEGALVSSSSARAMLAIAASLAAGRPVDLRETVVGLDATNTALVATALVTAAQATDRVSVDLAPRQLPDWLRD